LNACKAHTLILTGVATKFLSITGTDAHRYDYRIKMVEEDTASAPPEAHKAALRALEYLQNEAIIRVNEVIEAMKAFRLPYRIAARYFLIII
jgi:nicotinamidase-related amidase